MTTESDTTAGFICPESEYHGNPFRYCGVPGCGWIEDAPHEEARAAFIAWFKAARGRTDAPADVIAGEHWDSLNANMQGALREAATSGHRTEWAVRSDDGHVYEVQGKDRHTAIREASLLRVDEPGVRVVERRVCGWAKTLLHSPGAVPASAAGRGASVCAACGAPDPDGPISADGDPWCGDCYAAMVADAYPAVQSDEASASEDHG